MEFVRLLAAASGEDLTQYTGGEALLADVQDPAVDWGYDKWLINGYGDGRFRPDESITRAEAAAMLDRYMSYRYTALPAGCGTGMPSMDNIPAWAQTAVTRCWMYGVIDTGYALDFRPGDAVSPAEAGQWIANVNALSVGAIGPGEAAAYADKLADALNEKGNWMISPYSIRLCLAMLANGANGETRTELLRALDIDDLDTFNAGVKALLERYDGYARIMALETADSLWLNQSQFDGRGAFLPGYQKNMADFFRAEAQSVTDENSVERVNAWVNEKTHGKIPTILEEEHREFATALVNAVYFKAAWENTFGKYATAPGDFKNADGTISQIDLMHATANFGYFSTPGVEALCMDYKREAMEEDFSNYESFPDASFSMYVILADGDLDVQHFLDTAAFETSRVKVTLPKFKLEYSVALDDALKALGVQTAYDVQKADFSGMIDPSLTGVYLDTVLHKTYIGVDEEGTEAAAVTAALTRATSALIERPPLIRTFTADRPFYFAIRDNTAGELLFLGRYEQAK
jgi:serpin B